MNKTLNTVAALLLIIWTFIYFGFEVHRTIHALPVLACILILVNTFYHRKKNHNN